MAVRALLAVAVLAAGCECEADPAPLGPPPALQTRDPVEARLHTDVGTVHCTLDPARAPGAAAMFVGFARGDVAWIDPDGERVDRPLYRDLAFHRAIAGVLVQTGCPRGDGTGHPGYRIPLEPDESDTRRLAETGALVMAAYTPPPGRADTDPPPPGHVIGSQFGVLLGDHRHLVGRVTVLGRCDDLAIVDAISRAPAAERARLRSVSVER